MTLARQMSRRKLMIGGATLACGWAAESPKAPWIDRRDLFEAGQDGYALYRIPGMVVTRKGTLLAYCEARKSERGDWGPIDIYLQE